MVEEFVKHYPNLERVHLESKLPLNDSSEEKIRIDEEGLAAIHFQHLTSLSLSGFYLNGSPLLSVMKFGYILSLNLSQSFYSISQIIANCPKLEILHLNVNAIQPNSSFFMNLDVFLGSAEKLREFRYEIDFLYLA